MLADGRYIYFNSARSGAMQIWRIGARDGSNPEQVTKEPGYRDWFPHFSPHGRWIVFVSFGLDVELGDHPPNRDVVLRNHAGRGKRSAAHPYKAFWRARDDQCSFMVA